MRREFCSKLGGLVAATVVRGWLGTLDHQVVSYDPTVDPVNPDFRGPVIVGFWHEYLLMPLSLQGRTNTAILTSQHRDADLLSEAARVLGFRTVRGSTFRGGGRALLELMRGPRYNLGIAADGPRGPRRTMALGAIFLSSKMGIPLVPYGIGYDNPWRLKSWDKFALPRFYSRARMVQGPRLQIPARLDRAGLEYYRQRVEDVMNRLTLEAEAWAVAGSRKLGQRVMRPDPAPPRNQPEETEIEERQPLPGYVPPELLRARRQPQESASRVA